MQSSRMFNLLMFSFVVQYLQGSGIMWKSYNFPVFLLTESGTEILQQVIVRLLILSKEMLGLFMFLHLPDTSDGLLQFEIVSLC